MASPTDGAGDASKPTFARLARLEGFLTVDPDNATLLREYAREAHHVGRYDAALAVIDRLSRAGQSTSADEQLAASALRRMGRLDEAVRRLNDERIKWPGDTHLGLELARCHFAARRFELALDCLPQGLGADDPAAEAAALHVRLLHHLGRAEEVDAALQVLPQSVREADAVQAARLPVLIDLGELDAAVQVAQRLETARADGSPMPYEVAEPLALAALDAGQSGEALAWIDTALRARQDDGRIWLSKGLAHLQDGQAAEGTAALREAVRLMPEHAGSHLALGWAHLVAGDRSRARAAFEAGVAASPALADGHGSLAVVDALDGQTEAAQTRIRKARGLDAQCASAQFAALILRDPNGQDIRRLADHVLGQARRARRTTPRASP